MRRRDGKPLWIDETKQGGEVLQPTDLAKSQYNEAWLQNLIHNHPETLPIEQIEPGFGKLIPLCRELPVLFGGGRSGALDNLLATRDGGIMLVEAKLWRNPEARRSAVAQALEYAAAVFQMGYSKLEEAVLRARAVDKMQGASLFEIVAADSSGIDEEEFFDALSRNLTRGRAVIAVVGDGIREDIVPIANLVQSHAGHRFTFALVELAVYETPATGVRLIVPSILAQTELVERGVVRIEGDGQPGVRVVVEPVTTPSNASSGRRMGISEDEFFEQLGQRYPLLSEVLKSFLNKAEAFGVYADMQAGLSLKRAAPTGRPLNMGYIEKNGFVDTGPSSWGDRRSPGRRYNEKLAALTGFSLFEAKTGETALRAAAGKMPRISDLLPQHEQAWLDAMVQYIQDIMSASPQD